MVGFIVDCKNIWDRYSRDEISVYAAQASFFTVIAFFPFIMLLMTLLQFLPGVSKTDLLRELLRIVPPMLDSFVEEIVEDLYVKSAGTVLSVTALTALWSASRGMMGIERGLNRIFRCNEKRNYVLRRLICSVYTLIFLLLCLFSLGLIVLGNSIQNLLLKWFPVLADAAALLISFRFVLSLALFMSAFLSLYTIVPQKKHTPATQLAGAGFTTIGWLIFSYGFSLYFKYFSNFSYMYGSLTAIVLVMLWLYFCISILFIGAELNCFIAERGHQYPRSSLTASAKDDSGSSSITRSKAPSASSSRPSA